MRLIKMMFLQVLSIIVSVGAVWGGFYYVFGMSTVTATVDGNPFAGAEVFVNGKQVGVTPYQSRLGLGAFTIEVKPPLTTGKRYTRNFTYYLFTIVVGASCEADFLSETAIRKEEIELAVESAKGACDSTVDHCAFVGNRTQCIFQEDCDGDGMPDATDCDPCNCAVQTCKDGGS